MDLLGNGMEFFFEQTDSRCLLIPSTQMLVTVFNAYNLFKKANVNIF
jgi:hypothetical protein